MRYVRAFFVGAIAGTVLAIVGAVLGPQVTFSLLLLLLVASALIQR